MASHGILLLRIALGVVFLWFGAWKLIPGPSPAETLAGKTIEALTFGVVPASVAVPVLALWEVAIGSRVAHRSVDAGHPLAAVGVVGTFLTEQGDGRQLASGGRRGRAHAYLSRLGLSRWSATLFTATPVTGAGLALIVPNAVAILGSARLPVAIEPQVKVVEEPSASPPRRALPDLPAYGPLRSGRWPRTSH